MRVHLLFIASEWGISSGGVNSFNYDFCNSIVKISKKQSDITVYCLSLTAVSDIDKYNVKKEGIELISLSNSYDENVANGECIPVSFVECVNKLCNFDAGDKLVWIGHDIITGNLANLFKSKFSNYSSISVVFHHMNYDEYYKLAKMDSEKAILKVECQKKVLENASYIWAIGPTLYQSASDYCGNDNPERIKMIIPGMLEFENDISESDFYIPNRFTVLLFGRMEEKNDYVKQVKLAIAGFSRAYQRDLESPSIKTFKGEPKLCIVGYSKENMEEEEERVEEIIRNYCTEKSINYNLVEYITNRNELKDLIKNSSLVLMPSRHEGFGLAAYEAISAGVPVIISDSIGLYHFLNKVVKGNTNGLFRSIKVSGLTDKKTGAPREEDVDNLASSILNALSYYKSSKSAAIMLRNMLRNEGYSWENCANEFLNNVLDLVMNEE